MSLETLAVVLRVVVLTGGVLFAFAILFFGFHIVLREYRHLNTWVKMKEFLQLSAQAGLEADVTKGTLSLSRTTPGILLIALGTVILALCVFQRLEYSVKESPVPAQPSFIEPASSKFEEQVSQALQELDRRVTRLEAKVFSKQSADSSLPRRTSFLQTAVFRQTVEEENPGFDFAFRPPGVQTNEVASYQQDTAILSKWLSSVPQIKGKPVPDQIQILLQKHGDVPVTMYSRLVDSPRTTVQLAKEEYGHVRFAPLLESFNPRLPAGGASVPKYTRISIYLPATAPVSAYRREVNIKIAGMSRAQVYDQVLAQVNEILKTEEYQKNPAGWWKARFPQLQQLEFAKLLNTETGRQWGIREIASEEYESPELLAKIHFGDRKYANILKFINYHLPTAFANPKAPLRKSTKFLVLHLIEF